MVSEFNPFWVPGVRWVFLEKGVSIGLDQPMILRKYGLRANLTFTLDEVKLDGSLVFLLVGNAFDTNTNISFSMMKSMMPDAQLSLATFPNMLVISPDSDAQIVFDIMKEQYDNGPGLLGIQASKMV